MVRNIFPLFLFIGLVNPLWAQDIYLKMDENCMDRLEYSDGNAENPYVSYSFKLGEKQFANFDVGVESKKWVSDLPGKTTNCSSLKINKEFVQKVNEGDVQLFIVRESPTHYHIAPVEKAGLLETFGGTMEFTGDDSEFSVFLNNPVSGINLALPASKSEVYLDGTINYQCMKGYILQKKDNYNSKSFKEYVIIPELGIVQRASVAKTGFVDDLVRDNDYKLTKVDDMLFSTVLAGVCDKVQASYYDKLSGTTSDLPSSYDNLASKSGVPTSYGDTPCGPATEPGTHYVQKGETLYGISKKYGIPVAQLQDWNKLADGNVISLCQMLWVSQPSNTGAATPTGETTEKGGNSGSQGSGYWTKSVAEHQVRSGETIASLASMYGYTEARFRKMNGLSAKETVRPGQRLRTNDCNCPTLETSTKDTPLPYDQATEKLTPKDGSSTTKAIDNKDVYYRPITVHLVKSTDTWYSIAKQYNTSVERILELNGMTKDDKLTTDQRIYVQ